MQILGRWTLLLSFWTLALTSVDRAQGAEPFAIVASSLRDGQSVELSKLEWKYQPGDSPFGDDPAWADPLFDDRAWETLNGTAITLGNMPRSGWRGIGWFRLRLRVDPALSNQPLALVMVHFGASEIYLDGRLVQRFGVVGATPSTEAAYNPNILPVGVVLDGQNEHVIAIRHSCQTMRDPDSGWGRWFARQSVRPGLNVSTNGTIGYGAGFGIRIEDLRQALDRRDALQSNFRYSQMRVALFLAIGLLHLLLYRFYPRQRANLFFGLFACVAAVYNLMAGSSTVIHADAAAVVALFAGRLLALSFAPALLLGFIYSAFSIHRSRWFWIWLIIAVLFIPIELSFPVTSWGRVIQLAIRLFPILEVIRVITLLVKMKTDNVGIISAAMLIYMLVNSLTPYAVSGVIPGAAFTTAALNAASIILTISFSAFLARQFARTSRDLEAQLLQVETLSAKALEHERREAESRLQHAQEKAENERRARELEEARQLQLSMLPQNLPQLPGLEIAVYMKPASEVGGDYYDFHLGEDGTLTVAVGDAAGHGLKAGTLVASVKSLFVSLAYHPDITYIFDRMNRVLKAMKLRSLFMAMTMIKVKDGQLTVGIAGMPPILIYRAAEQQIIEIAIKAVPLGGLAKYQYKQEELTLGARDVVVLMSDGLPERFNEVGEMLDYEATKSALAETAGRSPQQIIEHLVSVGDTWAGGRPQDDDVTFVVLKFE